MDRILKANCKELCTLELSCRFFLISIYSYYTLFIYTYFSIYILTFYIQCSSIFPIILTYSLKFLCKFVVFVLVCLALLLVLFSFSLNIWKCQFFKIYSSPNSKMMLENWPRKIKKSVNRPCMPFNSYFFLFFHFFNISYIWYQ